MEGGKRAYKEGFGQLKELKSEIEHLQHLLEQSRRRLQSDFENWYAKQGSAAGPAGGGAAGAAAGAAAGMLEPQVRHDGYGGHGTSPLGACAPPGAMAAAASPRRPAPPPDAAWAGGCPARAGSTKPVGLSAPLPQFPAAVSSATGGAGPKLTGNPEVDAEITAFHQARELLVQQRMHGVSKAKLAARA
jgi:hypothetical protein|eukprot:gene9084-2172_t